MKDPRRLALSAVVFLVVLRIAIGWQLLYEGLWKIGTLETTSPWSAAGYLKNSQGPMRATFRNMAGDPDELGWLDYDTVVGRWDDWANRFRGHYQLDEKQAESLRRLMEGAHSVVKDRKVYVAELQKLPSGVETLNPRGGVSKDIIWFDAKAKRLYVNGERFMRPNERAKVESLVKGREDEEASKFLTAVDQVFTRQKRGMGYRDRLAGALKGNADLLGNDDWQRVGKLKEYRERLTRYEDRLAKASTEFEWDHLQKTNKELQTLRGEVTSPIKAMEKELKDAADKLLTTEQRSRGAVPEPWTTLRIVNTMTIAGLTILGVLLILGLTTRLAALAAALMLFNFYLAMPPLPGVPEMPGPEHSFIVNKNLIEVIALLGIALMPTGQWFGLDGLLSRCCSRCCGKSKSGDAEASSGSAVAATAESAGGDSVEQTTE